MYRFNPAECFLWELITPRGVKVEEKVVKDLYMVKELGGQEISPSEDL